MIRFNEFQLFRGFSKNNQNSLNSKNKGFIKH